MDHVAIMDYTVIIDNAVITDNAAQYWGSLFTPSFPYDRYANHTKKFCLIS
jgi:hypothetical protein